jgi:hypothetical protein
MTNQPLTFDPVNLFVIDRETSFFPQICTEFSYFVTETVCIIPIWEVVVRVFFNYVRYRIMFKLIIFGVFLRLISHSWLSRPQGPSTTNLKSMSNLYLPHASTVTFFTLFHLRSTSTILLLIIANLTLSSENIPSSTYS